MGEQHVHEAEKQRGQATIHANDKVAGDGLTSRGGVPTLCAARSRQRCRTTPHNSRQCRCSAAAHSADLRSGGASSSRPLYRVFPSEKGTYLYLIMCLICRFIVSTKRAMKYRSRMGQKTGMLKMEKKVITKATQKAFVIEYQNLNSGSLRMNGRNSSSREVGSVGPSVSGSLCGERKPISRLST